jgi:WD40 repeat protein
MLVGLKNGTITVVKEYLEPNDPDGRLEIMHSHSKGELWGLTNLSGEAVVTSGDDNTVIFWDFAQRKLVKKFKISDREEKAVNQVGLLKMTELPDSQVSRALALDKQWLAIGINDGSVSIRKAPKWDVEVQLLRAAQGWIETLAFSPDGTMLAVGSHDNKMYLYSTATWTLKKVLEGHTGYIHALDWSLDSSYLRTNGSDGELLFWCGAAGWTLDRNGKYNTVATEWATHTVKFAWHTTGITPNECEAMFNNSCAVSED